MNTVLYYPHVLPAPGWLKMAALCWDEVHVIGEVPTGYDTPEYRLLAETLGDVVKRSCLKEEEIQAIWPDFLCWAEEHADRLRLDDLEEPHGLPGVTRSAIEGLQIGKIALAPDEAQRYRQDSEVRQRRIDDLIERGLAAHEWRKAGRRVPEWDLDRYDTTESPCGIREPTADEERFHALREQSFEARRRQDIELAERLWQESEAIRERNLVDIGHEQRTIVMRRDLALHYLALCCSRKAKIERRDLAAGTGAFVDTALYAPDYARGTVALQMLEAFLPRDIDLVPAENIAAFRHERAAQRLSFQTAIQDIVAEYSAVAAEGDLQRLQARIVDIAKARAEDARLAYDRARIDVAQKAVTVSLAPPAMATVLASALGIGVIVPAALGAMLSLFTARLILDSRAAATGRIGNYWSYALDLARL